MTYTDRDGDVWTVTGRTTGGEPVLSCPTPTDPADAGDGPSYPWTLRTVGAAFGPLEVTA
ncbi:phiSA1p31-related protein [Streptomyces sp. NPDC002644]